MNEIKQNSPYAWFLAARPKTLTGAIIPVLLGSALAFSDGQFKTAPALLCALLPAACRLPPTLSTTSSTSRKGPTVGKTGWAAARLRRRLITPAAMKTGIGIALTLSCLAGLAVLFTVWGQLPHGGWELVVLGVVCILFAFLYTTLLSYRGWGDVLVLVFFGFVPVCGTYYVQAYTLNMDVVVLSLVSGLAIDTLLMMNNYRDREQDAVSGKCTLVVRYGKKFGENMYLALGIAAVLLCFWFVYTGKLTPLEFIWAPCVYLYMHALTWRKMIQIGSGKKLNSILGETSRNMLFLGLLLAVALN